MLLKVIFFSFVCLIYSSSATHRIVCGRHAKLVWSKNDCFPTCECRSPVCPAIAPLRAVKVCQCKPGYIFLSSNDKTCVKCEECPNTCSGLNFVWNPCGSHCPPTCQNRNPGPCILSCNPGCFCKPGYLLNTENNECVREKLCPC